MSLPIPPAGIQHFPHLIRGGYAYVDKTHILYSLIQERPGCLLARPRRFGKSLLVSTLEALFQGERELFRGLWIDSSDYDWKPHPILRLDFTQLTSDNPASLEKALQSSLLSIAATYGIEGIEEDRLKETFNAVVEKLYKQLGPVVILIDEYDSPIVRYIDDPEKGEANREFLSQFYAHIKALERYIRFFFVTGVSQFAKVSLFSGMNNLQQLSFSKEYADLLGLTEEEIRKYFYPNIQYWAKKRKETEEELFALLKTWYNGYSFTKSPTPTTVYNPISVLNFLKTGELSNYWFQTATPSMVVKAATLHDFPLLSLQDDIKAGEEIALAHDISSMDVHILLYQTGYLTIRTFEEKTQTYVLGFPNEEVRRSFLNYLLPLFSKKSTLEIQDLYYQLANHLEQQDFQQFFHVFNVFLDSIPHHIHKNVEAYYHSLLYLFLKTLGFKVGAEVPTSHGRMDLLLKTEQNIFVFEFKINKTAQEALQQIVARGYANQFQQDKRPIFLIGANFSSHSRTVDDWVYQKKSPNR